MTSEKSATPSSWDIKRVRSELLSSHSSRKNARSLREFLETEDHLHVIRQLTTREQAKLLENIDRAAPTDFMKDPKLVATLGCISSDINMLPDSVGSLRWLKRRGEIEVASGGFTDTWRGYYGSRNVALKAFCNYPIQDLREAERILWREVPVWKRLTHENILPFHGIDRSIPPLALVYDWCESGNVTQYLESNPSTSRLGVLLQVAKGLQYLHSCGVVHGDLKGNNVLMSDDGKAKISDYGLSSIISNPTFAVPATPRAARSSRWLAPEIIDPPSKPGSKPTTASKPADIFAFAMLALEVFTGQVPFGSVKEDSVVDQIRIGKRPVKPQAAEQLGLTVDMWELLEKCWAANPNERPTIEGVVRALEGFAKRENDRNPVSRPSWCKSHSADSSTLCGEKSEPSKHRKHFCGLF